MSRAEMGTHCCSNLEVLIIFSEENLLHPAVPSPSPLGVSGLHLAHWHRHTPMELQVCRASLKKGFDICMWVIVVCPQMCINRLVCRNLFVCVCALPSTHHPHNHRSIYLSFTTGSFGSPWLTNVLIFAIWYVKLQRTSSHLDPRCYCQTAIFLS